MEQVVKEEDENSLEVKKIDGNQDQPSKDIDTVKKRKPNSYVKRGKADLAFLKGNQLKISFRN